MRKSLVLTSIFAMVLLALLASCGPEQPPASEPKVEAPAPAAIEIPEELKEQLKSSVKMLAGTLKGHLVAELDAKGPLEAFSVCATKAQELTAAASDERVFIHRVSLKVRNPADLPSDFERVQLERFEALHAEDKLPEGEFLTAQDDGRSAVYFFKPLLIDKPCLLCHGERDAIDPALLAKIETTYPGDEATGYKEGDLRGAFVARAYLE